MKTYTKSELKAQVDMVFREVEVLRVMASYYTMQGNMGDAEAGVLSDKLEDAKYTLADMMDKVKALACEG